MTTDPPRSRESARVGVRGSLAVLGIAELAARLDMRPETVAQWVHRGKVPEPDARLAMGPVWLETTIAAWRSPWQRPSYADYVDESWFTRGVLMLEDRVGLPFAHYTKAATGEEIVIWPTTGWESTLTQLQGGHTYRVWRLSPSPWSPADQIFPEDGNRKRIMGYFGGPDALHDSSDVLYRMTRAMDRQLGVIRDPG